MAPFWLQPPYPRKSFPKLDTSLDFDIETVSAKTTIEPNEKVAVLKCSQINANPAPIVTWKKDGVDVRNINLDSNVMHVTGKVGGLFSVSL